MRRSWLIEIAQRAPGADSPANSHLAWQMQTRTFSPSATETTREMYRARGFWVRVSLEGGSHQKIDVFPPHPIQRSN